MRKVRRERYNLFGSDGAGHVAPPIPRGDICTVCDGTGYPKFRKGKCFVCHGRGTKR